MALKDLIAEKGALDEAAIERVVTPFVRYDVEAKELSLLHAFASLSNKAKILVYLVALQGWRFVTDDDVAADARPADIELATGIPGGSLRPVLRALCDGHVIVERDSRYSVRSTSIPLIEAEVSGQDRIALSPRQKPVRSSKQKKGAEGATDAEEDAVPGEEGLTSRARPKQSKIQGKTGNVAATFDRWIKEGYFDQPRTLAEVQSRFRKEAVLVPQSSLPGYFLSAVRGGRLERDEVAQGSKTVWAYTTANKS